ncbi:hypothetical protein J8273_1562 [Carpediemonas membranifera]|uniref:Uncharacterized protein n=1 Tax=Carpediemonas membranifera TaxID=201153 RepID=A0A8J6BAA9_9EUKA|nr:hypothetical protein J8273_1562 [Carpediemonas membranifera]|eukprot:KAG9396554.1 hypothetical protein J8273_1562 [Carpediemonas membranifera]
MEHISAAILTNEDIDARIARLDAIRARLVAKRSSETKGHRDVQRETMIALYSRIPSECDEMPGDIPSLLRDAILHEFGEELASQATSTSHSTIEEAADTLSALELHHHSAMTFVGRVITILDGMPELSMNRPLAPGEDLPPRIFTLLQGSVWACLMGAGANPDLEHRVLKKAGEEWPNESKMHEKIRNALTPEAKCLWFLCKKFFFTWNAAEKDGESKLVTSIDDTGGWSYIHRLYMGRLFMFKTDRDATFTRASECPPSSRSTTATGPTSHRQQRACGAGARTSGASWGSRRRARSSTRPASHLPPVPRSPSSRPACPPGRSTALFPASHCSTTAPPSSLSGALSWLVWPASGLSA